MNAPTRHLLLEEMTREEARQIAPEALVVLPVGAVEQHGPHLPVGTDTFTVEHLARAAAAEAARLIRVAVAPTLPFGSSHHHLPFGGTLSLSTETYYRVVFELCESLIIGGFRRIFVLNGHGGNNELIQLAIRDLALKHPACLAGASYWNVAWDALVEAGAHRRGNLPGHAGRFETSQVLALRPELVHEPRPHREAVNDSNPRSFYGPYRLESHGSWQAIDGYTDSPDLGTAADGKEYLTATEKALAKALVEFYRTTG
ncbi:MAG: creatininase family protein [Acidobacteriota bacterium]